MKQKDTAIYCQTERNSPLSNQQNDLDSCFFRLLAYAHANKLNVIAYYEDYYKDQSTRSNDGLSTLLVDLKKKKFRMVLFLDDNRMPICTEDFKYASHF